jgi:DNA repair exonuclease SbcCD ATPase subunit
LDFHEIFKKGAKTINHSVLTAKGKVQSIENWLRNNKLDNSNILPMKKLEISSDEDEKALRSLLVEFENIVSTNRKISENELKKKLLGQIKIRDITNIKIPDKMKWDDLSRKIGEYNFAIRQSEATIDSISEIGDECPTCSQPVSPEFVEEMVSGASNSIRKMTQSRDSTKKEIAQIKESVEGYEEAVAKRDDWGNLKRSISSDLPDESIDAIRLQEDIEILQAKIEKARGMIQEIMHENERRATQNTRIQVIQEQTQEFETELNSIETELEKNSAKLANLEVLKRAFSTSGLIAYKIENLVKDLEDMTNDYLAELSDGRFSINFVVNNDKLNVEITDNGKTVAITALSSGELTRVNTATLIAIRKLMSSISKSRINVLFLDEVINVLDETGREKLVEILLKEDDLNTYVVSHGWTHPLLEKIEVIKENNISRLE